MPARQNAGQTPREPSHHNPAEFNQTWNSYAEMTRAFHLLRQGNQYFARQLPNGSYRPAKLGKLDLPAVWDGRETVGLYSIRRDNMTRWGCIDFDNHDPSSNTDWLPDATAEFNRLSKLFAETWLVESSRSEGMSPGYHVFVFSDELIPAEIMRSTIGTSIHEIFPKQDTIDASKPTAKGALVRMPGLHQRKKIWSRILKTVGRAIDSVPEYVEDWKDPTSEANLQSLEAVTTRGLALTAYGQRWNAQQLLAARLKGRATEEQSELVFASWYRRNSKHIRTGFDESKREFMQWLHLAEPCDTTIPSYDIEKYSPFIDSLEPQYGVSLSRLKAGARMMLRAYEHSRVKGLHPFWLSCRDLAKYLKCSIRTASRIRIGLVSAGMLALVERGAMGVASTYLLLWDSYDSECVGCGGCGSVECAGLLARSVPGREGKGNAI